MVIDKQQKIFLQPAPLISVIIPFYNDEQYLLRAVKSVLNQSYTNFEVIIVDDGSEKGLDDITNLFKDPRLFYYRYLPHRNANVARNFGIEKAVGEYIAMLDADDEWLDSHLKDCLELLQKRKADGIYGSLIVKSSDKQQYFKAQAIAENEKMINYLLSHGYGAQTSTLFMTRKSATMIRWDESLKRHQDYDFVVRFAKKFHFEVKVPPSVIYHPVPKQTKIDYASCIQFIKKNKRDINPLLYNQYHHNMYKMLMQRGGEKKYEEYYKRESVRYKRVLSYQQYLAMFQPGSRIEHCQCKFAYVWGILFNY